MLPSKTFFVHPLRHDVPDKITSVVFHLSQLPQWFFIRKDEAKSISPKMVFVMNVPSASRDGLEKPGLTSTTDTSLNLEAVKGIPFSSNF